MTSDSNDTPPDRPPRPPDDEGAELARRRIAEYGRSPDDDSSSPAPRSSPLTVTEGEALLRNPYVLAGLAVAGAIVLAVFVVIVFGSRSSKSSGLGGGVQINPLTPQPGRGVVVKSVSGATVREGPGLDYPAVGELNRGQDIEVIGRNADSSWYTVYFPGSNLPGWVTKTAINVPDGAEIPIVEITPIPRPSVIIPTSTLEPVTATPTVTPTGTATPSGGPDLVATIFQGSCAAGRPLIISVRNAGPVPLTSRGVAVVVQSSSGDTLASTIQVLTLAVGDTREIDTGYTVQQPRVTAVVDPFRTLADPNIANNRVDCVVSILPTPATAGPSPTPTRTPGPGTPTATP